MLPVRRNLLPAFSITPSRKSGAKVRPIPLHASPSQKILQKNLSEKAKKLIVRGKISVLGLKNQITGYQQAGHNLRGYPSNSK
jgi:hypothetical protein